MKHLFVSVVAVVSLFVALPVEAATLKADYQFANTFASSVAGAPDLTPIAQGGPATTGTFTTETVNGTPNVPVFLFDGNRGLIANTAGVVPNNSYSIVFFARLDTLALPPNSISKILDFKNRTSDSGQYIVGGVPTFYDGLLPEVPGVGLFVDGTYSQFVLTRDNAGTVSVYLDGAPLYNFADTGNLTTLDVDLLTLFADDPNTTGVPLGLSIEAASGAIARLRLYDGALTADEVAGLDTLVPEPVACGLMTIGGALMLRFLKYSSSRRQRATY